MSFENNFFKINFDKSNSLLTIIAKNDLPLVDEEFDDLVKSLDVFYQGCEKNKVKFKMWFDLRNLGLLDKKYYLKLIEFFKEKEIISQNFLIGTIVLSNNNIINGVINKFLYFYDNKRPIKITNNEEEGVKFLSEQK